MCVTHKLYFSGKVSKHYNMHEFARMPLGDMLRFWSQCSVAYILVDINNKTIAKMVKAEGERSVDCMIGKHLKLY